MDTIISNELAKFIEKDATAEYWRRIFALADLSDDAPLYTGFDPDGIAHNIVGEPEQAWNYFYRLKVVFGMNEEQFRIAMDEYCEMNALPLDEKWKGFFVWFFKQVKESK